MANKEHSSMSLNTEKHGRLYAIALLATFAAEIKREQRFSHWSALSEDLDESRGEVTLYRKGPQSVTLNTWVMELYRRGTVDAIAGFFVVFTDYVGSTIAGTVPDASFYAAKEKTGALPLAGSVTYRDRREATAALAAGKGSYKPRAGR